MRPVGPVIPFLEFSTDEGIDAMSHYAFAYTTPERQLHSVKVTILMTDKRYAYLGMIELYRHGLEQLGWTEELVKPMCRAMVRAHMLQRCQHLLGAWDRKSLCS